MIDSGYSKLAAAIVGQAIKEYKTALNQLKTNPNNRIALANIDEIKQFFNSQWFQLLRELAPEQIPLEINKKLGGIKN